MIEENGGKPSWVEIGEALGKNPEAARSIWRKAKAKRGKETITTKNVSENQKELTSVSDRITTVDELLAYCNVDMDEWIEVSREIAKSTTKIASNVEKDLFFDDGRISGINRRGSTELIPVVRIKVNLVRKHPKSIEPVVQPIETKVEIVPPKIEKKPTKMKWLVGGDQQIGFERGKSGEIVPYHDRLAMSVFEQIAAYDDFDGILLLGDTVDWTEFGKYTITPNQYGLTQSSICEAYWHYSKLRAAKPKAKIVQMLGNHDLRPETQVENNVKGLWDVKLPDEVSLNLPPVYHPMRLTSAHKLGIEWHDSYPDGIYWLNEFMYTTHGTAALSRSGATVMKLINEIDYSVIFGHIHRIELAMKTIHTSKGIKFIVAMSPGCLCSIEGTVPAVKKRNNWQQGCAVLAFDDNLPLPSIELIPIVNGRAIYDGNVFEGHFNLDQLKDETNWSIF